MEEESTRSRVWKFQGENELFLTERVSGQQKDPDPICAWQLVCSNASHLLKYQESEEARVPFLAVTPQSPATGAPGGANIDLSSSNCSSKWYSYRSDTQATAQIVKIAGSQYMYLTSFATIGRQYWPPFCQKHFRSFSFRTVLVTREEQLRCLPYGIQTAR